MYCNHCGKVIQEDACFCAYCGQRVGAPAVHHPLQRPRGSRKIAGVCAGFAEHCDWDVTVVRLVTVLLVFFTFPAAIIAYVVAWVVMPEEPYRYEVPTGARAA